MIIQQADRRRSRTADLFRPPADSHSAASRSFQRGLPYRCCWLAISVCLLIGSPSAIPLSSLACLESDTTHRPVFTEATAMLVVCRRRLRADRQKRAWQPCRRRHADDPKRSSQSAGGISQIASYPQFKFTEPIRNMVAITTDHSADRVATARVTSADAHFRRLSRSPGNRTEPSSTTNWTPPGWSLRNVVRLFGLTKSSESLYRAWGISAVMWPHLRRDIPAPKSIFPR